MLTAHLRKNWLCYQTDTSALDLDLSFDMTSAVEKGLEIWYWECKEPVYVCMYVCVCVYMYIYGMCIYVYMCVYIYIYIS